MQLSGHVGGGGGRGGRRGGGRSEKAFGRADHDGATCIVVQCMYLYMYIHIFIYYAQMTS